MFQGAKQETFQSGKFPTNGVRSGIWTCTCYWRKDPVVLFVNCVKNKGGTEPV